MRFEAPLLATATPEQRAVADRVRELLPRIADRAERTERLRMLPQESVQELTGSGLFDLLRPARHGGLEADPVLFYALIVELSQACGSTGWVSSALGVHPWLLALFDPSAQDAVWGVDPGARISSSMAPTGRATLLPDGSYELSGRWSYSSGCDHCSWAFLGALVHDEQGSVSDFRVFLVPRSDYRIENVWNAIGLVGTGSNDLLAQNVSVPAAFSLSMDELQSCTGPGQAVNDGPLYRLPFHSIFTCSVTAPLIGMARGSLAEHVRHQTGRVRAAFAGERTAADPFAAATIARASARIDSAWALLVMDLHEELDHARADTPIPTELRLRVRRDQVLGSEQALEAIDALFSNSGGRVLTQGTYLQRAWRDAHAGGMHAANDVERVLRLYGSERLGVEIEPGMY